ncbi:MAG: hypothetical protein L6R42_000698 [Xanthoria sp. 1 TBL-2021]|nr:MAG: hypothetical protein L6R42_000698 [Xanthoria sp. 1 TBL-2021]
MQVYAPEWIRFPANVYPGGGDDAWSVLLTGLNNNVGSAQGASNSDSDSKDADSQANPSPKAAPSPITSYTSAPSTPSPAANPKPSSNAGAAVAQPDATKDKPPSTITRASTVVVTAPGQTQPVAVSAAETTAPSKGPNTAGIAAGVVVGVVALGAIAGGLFLFLRRRKRRALEEEYQRNPVNPFETETESKPPASSHSMSDSRLEPSVMMQRRQSDGSIADNQDYSRRILKASPGYGSDEQ